VAADVLPGRPHGQVAQCPQSLVHGRRAYGPGARIVQFRRSSVPTGSGTVRDSRRTGS
jgi:hypothetical protein